MVRPDKREGYDVLVWQDDAGRIRCSTYSPNGLWFLRTIIPVYREPAIVDISGINEQIFHDNVPPMIRVGYLNVKTNNVIQMDRNTLH